MINESLKKSEIFSTQELSLAAALVSWKFILHGVNKGDSNRATFIFLKTSLLTRAVQSFWNDTGRISPKDYFNALREVKSRIYSD